MRRRLRPSDLVARLGGEEFALMLTETDAAGALILAERLRAAVAADAVQTSAVALPVTASFGVTEFRAAEARWESALKRADEALYRAKREGRNRVCAG